MTEGKVNGSRIQWLDVAKGITIILMVIGHSSIPKILSDFIWTFHMPFFFMASGFTSKFNGGGISRLSAGN